MMAKLAPQADVWYNQGSKIVAPAVLDIPRSRIHLIGDVPMDTLPPYAENGNIPDASGIYKITCTVTKKIYVGSAAHLSRRERDHFHDLRQNKHKNRHLQNAWNKYGEQSFTFEVLELVLPMSLTAREQYWFKRLQPFGRRGFNIAREAGSTLGVIYTPEARENLRRRPQSQIGRKMPPEAVEKVRLAHLGRKLSPEHIEKIRGRKDSPETREKKRQASTGNKHNLGRKHTPEAIEKMRQTQRTREYTPEEIERARKLGQANRGRKHTLEARAHMGQSRIGKKRSPEAIEKTRQANIGRKHTPEARAHYSVAAKNRSPEHREKIRQANIGKVNESQLKTLIVTAPDGTEYIAHGISRFCREHGLNAGHLVQVARGTRNHCKGWKAKYDDKEVV